MNTAPTLAARDRAVWSLFDDWCAGSDRLALPATPDTLARFITENPAAASTQRRRITVINSVHRTTEHPAPGDAETVRQMVNQTRAERLARLTADVAGVIDRLPAAGWTAGLFGRRDGLLLLLAAAGLSFEQISALRRADLSAAGDTLVIERHRIILTAPPYPGSVSPAQVYRRWAQILDFQDRAPSTRLLANRLDADRLPTEFSPRSLTDRALAQQQSAPIFTPIDRWGHTAFDRSALSAHSIAGIVATHLSGRSPTHRRYRPRVRHDDVPEPYQPPTYPETVLDDGYYDRGLQARRTAQASLTDVVDVLDDVEDRADEIMEKLLAVLDGQL